MSVQRPSLTEPFPLSRARETFADWFESPPKHSRLSALSSWSFMPPPELVTVRGAGELAPVTAGAVAGVLAGPAMLAVSTWVAGHPLGLVTRLGQWMSRGAVTGTSRLAVGWLVAVAFGSLVGAGFGALTRRLRRFVPTLLFAVVLSFAGWTVFHTMLLRRIAPLLARSLPFVPMVLGAMTFGAVLALEVPLRTRR